MATVRSMMLAIMLVAALAQSATAETYIVGDDAGWTIPSAISFYDDWAASKTFKVGDKLTFKYTIGHNVYQVSGADARGCVSTNTLAIYTQANPTITLTQAGETGYICEVMAHCDLGMRMTLTVAGGGTVPSNATAPTASPKAPPTPSAASRVQSTAAIIVGALLVVCATLVW